MHLRKLRSEEPIAARAGLDASAGLGGSPSPLLMVGYGAIQPAEPRQQPNSGARTRRVALVLVVCTVAVSAIIALASSQGSLASSQGPVALMGYRYPRQQQQLSFGLEDPWVGLPDDLAGPDPWESNFPEHNIWEGVGDPADSGSPPISSLVYSIQPERDDPVSQVVCRKEP